MPLADRAAEAAAHPFDLGETRPASDGRLVRYCRCGLVKGAAVHQPGGHRRTATVYGGHPFQVGGGTRRGKDGRTLHLCKDCRRAMNAMQHRPDAIPGPRPKAREKVQVTDRLVAWKAVGPGDVSARVAPGADLVEATEVRAEAADASPAWSRPTPEAGRVKASSVKESAEMVTLAIALDTALALPRDALDYQVRLKIAGLRDLLDLPVYGTLAAADAPKADDPPTELLEAIYPDALPPRERLVSPDGAVLGILRGIRNDRARELCKRAAHDGWTVAMTGGGHVALSRGRHRLIVSSTMGDGRRGHSWGNLRAQARRAGLNVEGL